MPANEEKGKKKSKGKSKNKILSVVVLILIVFVWLVIFAVLIRLNVGGFGSTLSPILKDIPIINRILPEATDDEIAYESDYPHKTLKDALAKIEGLKETNDKLSLEVEEYKNINGKLEEEIISLNEIKYKTDEFKQRVLEFERDVVFGDKALNIEEYKKFYESINPDNAEIIYRQVIGDLAESQEMKEKAEIYSQMNPRAAATIFETLSDDTDLLLDILSNMTSSSASKILSEMDPDLAGNLTKKLFK